MFRKKERKGLEKFVKVWKPLDYFVNVILSPIMWISNSSSSNRVNNLLNDLVVEYENNELEIKFSYGTLNFSNSKFSINIWISNYPYAYGSVYNNGVDGPLPTRYYRLLFNRWVESVYSKHMMGEKINVKR